jgi:hypothetical protein
VYFILWSRYWPGLEAAVLAGVHSSNYAWHPTVTVLQNLDSALITVASLTTEQRALLLVCTVCCLVWKSRRGLSVILTVSPKHFYGSCLPDHYHCSHWEVRLLTLTWTVCVPVWTCSVQFLVGHVTTWQYLLPLRAVTVFMIGLDVFFIVLAQLESVIRSLWPCIQAVILHASLTSMQWQNCPPSICKSPVRRPTTAAVTSSTTMRVCLNACWAASCHPMLWPFMWTHQSARWALAWGSPSSFVHFVAVHLLYGHVVVYIPAVHQPADLNSSRPAFIRSCVFGVFCCSCCSTFMFYVVNCDHKHTLTFSDC